MTPPSELIDTLSSLKRPVIAGHINPDVDAMGSMLALARSYDWQATIAAPRTHVGKKVAFLREMAPEVPAASEQDLAEADAVISLDTATTGRINIAGGWPAIEQKRIVCIDHHVTNTDYGQVNWVVDNASSTCEMVYRLLQTAGRPIDSLTASLLYAGLYADTAGFSLPSATPQSFEAAAALVRLGADIERVGTCLCRSMHLSDFDLLRLVYHNTRLIDNGRIAYSTLTHEEIIRSGCSSEDIDDQVSIPRSLSGILVAVLFSEIEPGLVRINLRGESGTPVLPIAQALGGGGHLQSAGVRVRGLMSEVVKRVLDQAITFLGNAG